VYQVAVDKERQWNAIGMGGVRRGGMANQHSHKRRHARVGFLRSGRQTTVWQGQAPKTLNPQNTQEKNQKNLDNAMKKLLKNFPPKAK
jgi:uncharacterized protein DUF4136